MTDEKTPTGYTRRSPTIALLVAGAVCTAFGQIDVPEGHWLGWFKRAIAGLGATLLAISNMRDLVRRKDPP